MQETSTKQILMCMQGKKISMHNCTPTKRTRMDTKIEINKRFGMPFFIPLIALICSFLLSSRKDQRLYNFNKYIYFFIGFVILGLAEITVRYSGISWSHSAIYYLIPVGISPIFYFILLKKFKYENLS
jgi:drug/metabolite transporter (DMT)-like permease